MVDPFIALYGLTLSGMGLFGWHRATLARRYLKHSHNPPPLVPSLSLSAEEREAPRLLVQLPLYNEGRVATRLIDSVCQLSYPPDLIEVQVLDDSTDSSAALVRAHVARWAERGVIITYHHRVDRVGYKAGALREGLLKAPEVELVAVFDADFIPPPDFLLRTVPYFKSAPTHQPSLRHERVGVVQARWGHLNRERSLLTRAQAILLDGHFMIEHTARHRSGCFFNFNGTAGLWDRRCIEEAGGWEHDTITEDLDLSYRAQLKGWRFIYLNDVSAPAELPEQMRAFKTQQHRWAKGSIQVALKLLPSLLRSELPWRVKREGLMHLTGNFAYLLMVIWSLITPSALEARLATAWPELFIWLDLLVFGGATLSVLFFYGLSQREVSPRRWVDRLKTLPAVLALGAGLAINNSKALLEALMGMESPFIRTPKLGELRDGRGDEPELEEAQGVSSSWTRGLSSYLELALSAHFVYAAYLCVTLRQWLSLPFMLLFAWGLAYVGLLSLLEERAERGLEQGA